MNKQEAIEKLAELEQKAVELKAIIDEPEVKPLFPEKGYILDSRGNVTAPPSNYGFTDTTRQGNTFWTIEEAMKEKERRKARTYCLERINQANKGDNGFFKYEDNYSLYAPNNDGVLSVTYNQTIRYFERDEYIRSKDKAVELANDPKFVEEWLLWKGVE